MAITFPRAFLTHKGPREISLRQMNVVGISRSPFSLATQTYEHPGECWAFDLSFPTMAVGQAEPWVAWLTSLRGPAGSFTMGVPRGAIPRGGATGSVTATGSARSYTVSLSGGSGSLFVGDWIDLGNGRRLHKVMADVTLGSPVTVDIWPALRATVSGAACAVRNAKGQWMLTAPVNWSIDVAGNYPPITIKAMEDMRP